MLAMEKSVSNKIYYFTFILSILVIALHSSYVENLNDALTGYDFSYIIQRLFLVISEAAVPSFFVVSGYLLFRKFTLKEYPKMLLSKVFSLIIPYFIWSVGAFLFMQIAFPLLKGEPIEITFKSAIIDILLSNEYPHLWFIRPLLVFFICSPLFYFAFKYLKKWSILIPAILFFIYMFFRPYYGGILLWIPLFFIGSYLAYFNIPIMNKYKPRLIGAISLTLLITLSIAFTLTHTKFEDYSYYCYRTFSPILVWLSFDLLTPLFNKENILTIFKTSGFIFFSHLFIVNGLKLLFQAGISIDSNYNCALLFFLVLISSSILTLAFTCLLRWFAKPVYKFLGGR